MADIAKLQIIVDSSQVKAANQNLQGFSKTAGVAQRATGGLSRAMGALTRVVGPLLAAFSFVQMIKAADRMTLLEGRVRQATETTGEFTQAWERLNKVATDTGAGLQAGVEIFQRLSFSRKEIKATVDEMLQFTEAVQKFGVVSGAGPAALKAGLTQLGQALSSDVARAEEFNSIMENIPVVGKAVADEFGITTGQLRRLVIEGKVLSKDVFAAMLNQTEKAREAFDQMPMTISRAWSMLSAQFDILAKEISDATSANELLAKGIIFAKNRLVEMTAVIAMLKNGFMAIALTAKQAFNDALVAFQNFYNKAAVAIEKISFGKFKPDLMTSAYSVDYTSQIAGLETKEDVMKRFGLLGEDDAAKASTATRKITTDYKKLAESLSDTEKEGKKAEDKIKDVTDQLKFNIEQLQRSNIEQEIYNNLRAAGVKRDSEAGRQIEQLTRTFENMSDTMSRQQDFVDDLSGAFVNFFDDASRGAESFGSSLKNLADDLLQVIYQFYVLEPLKNALTGGSSGGGGILGSLLGGVGSFFGGGSLFGSVANTASFSSRSFGSIFGSALGGAYGPGFATGGSFTVGGSGGTDSELVQFRATPGEMVNITRPGDSQGHTVNYTIDARGAAPGVEEKIKAVLMELRRVDRSIEPRATHAVRDANRRNPKFMKV